MMTGMAAPIADPRQIDPAACRESVASGSVRGRSPPATWRFSAGDTSESGWPPVDQTLIGNVARITVAAVRNVIATPIKIH